MLRITRAVELGAPAVHDSTHPWRGAPRRLFLREHFMSVLTRQFGILATTLVLLSGSYAVSSQPGLQAVERQIRERFGAIPQLQVESVVAAEIDGLYKVQLVDGPLVYVSADGGRFILGELYELREDGFVNLAEEARDGDRAELLATIDPTKMIIFAAHNERKATINVFTDVDCFYCQKLHEEIENYNELGIEVRYLAFPRKGVGSDTFDKMVSAWCSKDQQDALTRLKQQQTIPKQSCGNPVAEHFALGQAMGVRGTPALVLESGRVIPGYVSPVDLAPMLGIK